jgi:hypothetical protein
VSKLQAVLKPEDHTRAGRLLLCWLNGDKAGADLVLAEADAVAGGVAGLLFAVSDFNSTLLLLPTGNEANAREAVELTVKSYLDAEAGTGPGEPDEQSDPEDLPPI